MFDVLYFGTGALFSLYILVRMILAIGIYTARYLTHKNPSLDDIGVIGNIGLCDSDGNNTCWTYIVISSILIYVVVALLAVVGWPLIMILCVGNWLKIRRNKNLGD